MRRCSCGHDPDRGDRFCSRCGRTLGGATGPAIIVDDAGALGGDDASSTAHVVTGRSPRWTLLVAVVAIGLLAIVVLRWPGADGETASEPEPGGQEASTTTAPIERTTRTTSKRRAASSTTAATSAGVPGGPVLGERTGLGLVIFDLDGSRLLDLDTGETADLLVKRGELLTVAGTRVIYRPSRDGALLAILDVTAPEAGATMFDVIVDGWAELIAVEERRQVAWLSVWAGDGAPEVSGYSLVDGRRLDGEVRQWDSTLDQPGMDVALSPDGRWLVDAATHVDMTLVVDLDSGASWGIDPWVPTRSPQMAVVRLDRAEPDDDAG